MSNADYRRGYEAGKRDGHAEAFNRYVPFRGVADRPDANEWVMQWLVEYDADQRPWVALFDYQAALAHELELARERQANTSKLWDQALEEEDAAQKNARARAEERKAGGGLIHASYATVRQAFDGAKARARAEAARAELRQAHWVSVVSRLQSELADVNRLTAHMIETVVHATADQ